MAQGFTTAKIRQRRQLLDSRDEPRFTIAEIDAVAQQPQQKQQPQQPQQQPAAIHRHSLQVDQILEEMVNDLASLPGADFQPQQRRAVLLGMLDEVYVDAVNGFPPVTDPSKILAVFYVQKATVLEEAQARLDSRARWAVDAIPQPPARLAQAAPPPPPPAPSTAGSDGGPPARSVWDALPSSTPAPSTAKSDGGAPTRVLQDAPPSPPPAPSLARSGGGTPARLAQDALLPPPPPPSRARRGGGPPARLVQDALRPTQPAPSPGHEGGTTPARVGGPTSGRPGGNGPPRVGSATAGAASGLIMGGAGTPPATAAAADDAFGPTGGARFSGGGCCGGRRLRAHGLGETLRRLLLRRRGCGSRCLGRVAHMWLRADDLGAQRDNRYGLWGLAELARGCVFLVASRWPLVARLRVRDRRPGPISVAPGWVGGTGIAA